MPLPPARQRGGGGAYGVLVPGQPAQRRPRGHPGPAGPRGPPAGGGGRRRCGGHAGGLAPLEGRVGHPDAVGDSVTAMALRGASRGLLGASGGREEAGDEGPWLARRGGTGVPVPLASPASAVPSPCPCPPLPATCPARPRHLHRCAPSITSFYSSSPFLLLLPLPPPPPPPSSFCPVALVLLLCRSATVGLSI